MNPRAFWRVVAGRVALAVFLAAAWIVSSSSNASAGCGDYVLVNGKPVHAMHGAAEQQQEQMPATPRPFSRPCQGPECGRLPVQAPPAAPLPTNPFESSSPLAALCFSL